MKKKQKKNVWLSVVLCALMLFATVSIIGNTSGDEEDLNIDKFVELDWGTRDSDDKWDKGDYVAINMTKNGALSWFGVIYGTEENPNSILIFCLYIRFLGAAEVYQANGEFIGRYPIPIATVFGQKLEFLFEYDDNGRFTTPIPGMYEPHPEYADNGVFDFVPREKDPGLWAISDQHEDVNRAVNLSRPWSRSDIVETSDPVDTTTKSWDFSLYAEDIDYGINVKGKTVLDDPENVLEKLEFTFHVTAHVDEIDITGVPWYEVKVSSSDHRNVIDSEIKEYKNYVGNSVTADFKFDHLIKGWDFSDGDGIVLINHGFFANIIPEKVEEWLDIQFYKGIGGGGKAEYEALDPNQDDALLGVVSTNATEDEDADGDGIVDAKIVDKDVIHFKDNWQEIGELTWISNATVDGENDTIKYQVHGGQSFGEENFDDKGNRLEGFIIQGGYIYPAGNNIYHDPSLVAIALLFDIGWGLNLLPGYIVGGQFALALIGTIIISAFVAARNRKERKNKVSPYEQHNEPNPPENQSFGP